MLLQGRGPPSQWQRQTICNLFTLAEHNSLMAPNTVASTSNQAESFQRLFEAQAGAVLAYGLRRTDPDAAKDVVAETFLVAWQRLDAVPEDALPWLLGVARNVLRNRHRSTQRQNALEVKVRLEPSVAVDGFDREVDARLSILAALDRLPEGDQQILKLTAWDKLSVSRASSVVGCSEGAFKVRLHRARRRLAEELNSMETEKTR